MTNFKSIWILVVCLSSLNTSCTLVGQIDQLDNDNQASNKQVIQLEDPLANVSNNPRPNLLIEGFDQGQTVEIYTDPLCQQTVSLAKLQVESNPMQFQIQSSLTVDGVYKFYLKNMQSCIASKDEYTFDTTAPDKALSLSWQQTSPANALPVVAQWNRSISNDVKTQKIQYYSDASCVVPYGSEISLTSSALTANFSPSIDATFTFKILSFDLALNSSISDCSPPLIVDASIPQITNVILPASKTYKISEKIYFKVKYDVDINVSGSNIVIPLQVGSRSYNATRNTSGCDTDNRTVCFVFISTTHDDMDLDGIEFGSQIFLNGGSITGASNAVSAQTTLGTLNTAGILVNNPPQVKMSTMDTVLHEGQGTFTFDVTLSKSWNEVITVPYKVKGTSNSTDHNLIDGSIVFNPGEILKSVTFNILSDAVIETEESLSVFLNKPTNAFLDLRTDLLLLIKDSTPSLNVLNADVHDLNVCAVTSDQVAKCWGDNSSSQIQTPSTAVPILLAEPIATGVKQVGVGDKFICILKTNGDVFCKGYNNTGQVGDGTNTTRTAFTVVPQLTNVEKLEVSGQVVCAVTKSPDHDLYCWGTNSNYQVSSTGTSFNTPTAIATVSDVLDVSTDGATVCIILSGGELQCWGENSAGQVGNGTTSPNRVSAPFQVFPNGVSKVSVSSKSVCAIMTTNSELKCWGANAYSKLARTGGHLLSPTTIISNDVIDVQISSFNGCAIKIDQSMWCWGTRFFDSFVFSQSSPTIINPIEVGIQEARQLVFNSSSFSSDNNISCYISTGQHLKCTANNLKGMAGRGYPIRQNNPIDFGITAEKIFMGPSNACVLNSTNQMSCWGHSEQECQLGDSNCASKSYPIDNLLSNINKIIMGTTFNFAIANDQKFYAWGGSNYVHLGDKVQIRAKVPIHTHSIPITDMSAGENHVCTIYDGGELRCRGWNASGRTGPSTVVIEGENQVFPSGMSHVASAVEYNCAIKSSDGTVWCWGSGRLGNGAGGPSTVPVQVTGLSNVVELSMMSRHVCARTIAGAVWCWGNGLWGELGQGAFADATTPVQAIASDAKKIRVGGEHSCAIVGINNDLKCWGRNIYGQIGDGTTTNRSAPQTVLTGVKDIGLSRFSSCAIMLSDSSVKCWGDNYSIPSISGASYRGISVNPYEHRGYRLVYQVH